MGLNVNCLKLEFLGINMDPHLVSSLANNKYGCKEGLWSATWVCFSMVSLNVSLFGPPLLKRWKKGWSFIHIKGRSPYSYPSYIDQSSHIIFLLFPIPSKVSAMVERLYHNFLWKGSKERSSFHVLKRGKSGAANRGGSQMDLDISWWKWALWRKVIALKYGSSTLISNRVTFPFLRRRVLGRSTLIN